MYQQTYEILKCFPKIFFNNEMIPVHSVPWFFISVNKRLTYVTILITSAIVVVVRKNWSIKYFRWYIAIQIGYAIDINVKGISFIKQLSCKFSIKDFYWNIQKWDLTRIFILLIEFHLIRINFVVIIFKFVIIESA